METLTFEDVALASGSKRVGEIDALRALAMTAVVAEHDKLFSAGWAGVWLFYVVSGFVVTGSVIGRSGAVGGVRELIGFYVRRAARIWPIYFLMIALAVVFSLTARHGVPWPAIASLAGFYNNFALALGFGETPAFNTGHLWTISVEMQFYVLYGFVLILGGRKIASLVSIALLVLCPFGRLALSLHLSALGVPPLPAAFDIYAFSLLHFDAFGAGSLLALHQNALTRRSARCLFMAGAALFIGYGLAYAMVNLTLGARGAGVIRNVYSGILYGQFREVFLYDAVFIPAAGLLALIRVDALKLSLLSSPLVQRVGEVSYGAYVYHLPALAMAALLVGLACHHPAGIARFVMRGLQFAIALPLTILLAELSYRWVEKPIIRMASGWLRRQAA
jgi:peptidoglycan/LPS O-acetylase OafA/YrhL